MCATGATLLGGRRKARRAWRECTGTVAKLTIEEIGVHLLARSVVGVQEGKVVVVYVQSRHKQPPGKQSQETTSVQVAQSAGESTQQPSRF